MKSCVSTMVASLLLSSYGSGSGVAGGGERLARARGRLESWVADEQMPGVQYLAVGADGVLFEASVGVRDAATGESMEGTELLATFSITEVVTAITVLQLATRGALSLDAPLSRYLRDHPYGDGVTIRMLLAQTSGVPNPLPLDWFALESEALDRVAALRTVLAENDQLGAAPGSEYGYSNISYWLLEAVVEEVTGKGYPEYVAEEIFAPLGLASTDATFELPDPSALATGHTRVLRPMGIVLYLMARSEYWTDSARGWRRTARVRPFGLGYGGMFASASAMGAILKDLLASESVLLPEAARTVMFERQVTNDGELVPMSLGWGRSTGCPISASREVASAITATCVSIRRVGLRRCSWRTARRFRRDPSTRGVTNSTCCLWGEPLIDRGAFLLSDSNRFALEEFQPTTQGRTTRRSVRR